MSSGIKSFLSRTINSQAIPLDLSAKHWSESKKRHIIDQSKEALINGRSFHTAEELRKDILAK